MTPKQTEVGQKVTTSGFTGTIINICEWSRTETDVMVEVRLDRGDICVTCHDLISA